MKFDKDKVRMELLPFEALYEVSKILTFGAEKYAPESWKNVEKERYIGAMLRHLTSMKLGEKVDRESHLLHAAHMACNALFILYFEVKEAERERLYKVDSGTCKIRSTDSSGCSISERASDERQ